MVRNSKLTSYHQPELRKGQKERGDVSSYIPPTSQNPSNWNPSWMSDACATRKDPQWERLARDNLETHPTATKPETGSQVVEQFSQVPVPSCSPTGYPFPIRSLALSAHVSLWTFHFWVLDKSLLLGPGRDPHSCVPPVLSEILSVNIYVI